MIRRFVEDGQEFIEFVVPVRMSVSDFQEAYKSFGLDVPDPIPWLYNKGIERLGDMYSANIYQDIAWFAEGDAEVEG